MTILKSMLDSAAAYGLKIVLVWFGSYKKMHVCIMLPDWVIRDRTRFARVIKEDGSITPLLWPALMERNYWRRILLLSVRYFYSLRVKIPKIQ